MCLMSLYIFPLFLSLHWIFIRASRKTPFHFGQLSPTTVRKGLLLLYYLIREQDETQYYFLKAPFQKTFLFDL